MAVETLRPDAAGAECSIDGETGDACPNHYLNVDEVDTDEAETCVKTDSTEYQRDLYNLPASSGIGTINKITVYFRCWLERSDCHAKASIRSDSTVTDGAEKTAAEIETFETFSQEWAVNPADSEAWEWADMDDLQIGVSLLGYFADPGLFYALCTQVWVVVDYEAAVVHYGAATLSGVGTLACKGHGIYIGKATLSGIGTLAAIAKCIYIGKATLSGIGTLSAIAKCIYIGKATLAGVGTLAAKGMVIAWRPRTFYIRGAFTRRY